MKFICNSIVFWFYAASLFAQNRDLLSASVNYDSITIEREQMHNIFISLTETQFEVTSEGYNLIELYGTAPELNDLFCQFQKSSLSISKDRLRDYLDVELAYYYDISTYKEGSKTYDIAILYDADYPYLDDVMLKTINMLNRITHYYNSFLAYHFSHDRRMSYSLPNHYQGLCDGVINFEAQWYSLQGRNPKENYDVECIQMSILFAQCLVNSKHTGTYFDLNSLVSTNNISISRLYYYSSFVKQDQSIIREWIDSLNAVHSGY